MIEIAEPKGHYIARLLDKLRSVECTEICATAEALASFEERRIAAAKTTVWFVGGCKSWYLDAHLARWEQGCSYRAVAPSLDRCDVHAFCAVSATHSGVPMRGYARLHGPGRSRPERVLNRSRRAAAGKEGRAWYPALKRPATFGGRSATAEALAKLQGP